MSSLSRYADGFIDLLKNSSETVWTAVKLLEPLHYLSLSWATTVLPWIGVFALAYSSFHILTGKKTKGQMALLSITYAFVFSCFVVKEYQITDKDNNVLFEGRLAVGVYYPLKATSWLAEGFKDGANRMFSSNNNQDNAIFRMYETMSSTYANRLAGSGLDEIYRDYITKCTEHTSEKDASMWHSVGLLGGNGLFHLDSDPVSGATAEAVDNAVDNNITWQDHWDIYLFGNLTGVRETAVEMEVSNLREDAETELKKIQFGRDTRSTKNAYRLPTQEYWESRMLGGVTSNSDKYEKIYMPTFSRDAGNDYQFYSQNVISYTDQGGYTINPTNLNSSIILVKPNGENVALHEDDSYKFYAQSCYDLYKLTKHGFVSYINATRKSFDLQGVDHPNYVYGMSIEDAEIASRSAVTVATKQLLDGYERAGVPVYDNLDARYYEESKDKGWFEEYFGNDNDFSAAARGWLSELFNLFRAFNNTQAVPMMIGAIALIVAGLVAIYPFVMVFAFLYQSEGVIVKYYKHIIYWQIVLLFSYVVTLIGAYLMKVVNLYTVMNGLGPVSAADSMLNFAMAINIMGYTAPYLGHKLGKMLVFGENVDNDNANSPAHAATTQLASAAASLMAASKVFSGVSKLGMKMPNKPVQETSMMQGSSSPGGGGGYPSVGITPSLPGGGSGSPGGGQYMGKMELGFNPNSPNNDVNRLEGGVIDLDASSWSSNSSETSSSKKGNNNPQLPGPVV